MRSRTVKRSQGELIEQLRNELGAGENTEHLIDWLQDAWETLAMLKAQFGEARALQLYTASAPLSHICEREAVRV